MSTCEDFSSEIRRYEELKHINRSYYDLVALKFKEPSFDQPATMAVPKPKTKARKALNVRIEERLEPQIPPPDIPPVPSLNGIIGKCSKPFEKQLTKTDVDTKQCRVTIGKEDMTDAVAPLLKEGEDVNEGIPVKVYDANGKEYSMTFTLWSNKLYVFKKGWVDFLTDHGLLAHQDFVTFWAFRKLVTEELCFVITSRRTNVLERITKKKQKV